MSYRFVCDHCGKKFELETPEAKECPFCFWTSSVKREDVLASGKKSAPQPSQKGFAPRTRKPSSGNFSRNLIYLLRALLFLVLLAAVGFLAYKGYKLFTSSSHGAHLFSIKPQRDAKESPSAPVASGIAILSNPGAGS